MFENTEKFLPPIYHELTHLLFMLELSQNNSSSVEIESIKNKVDELISLIHAHNVLENINKLKI